jgi:hypothetical protein
VTELPPELARAAPDQLQERVPFYRGRNLSISSLESEALLDHRYDYPIRYLIRTILMVEFEEPNR